MGYGVMPYLVDFARLKVATKPGLDGYGLEKVCRKIGKPLGNASWSAMHGDWFETVDAALKKAGSGIKLTDYFWAGAPVKIVPPEDFPVVGHVKPTTVSKLASELAEVPVEARPGKGFAIPPDFREGDYTFSKGRTGIWSVKWEGKTLEEYNGRERQKRSYPSPTAARDVARASMEKRLKLGYAPSKWTVLRLRNERVKELTHGTYEFTKGKRNWQVRITGDMLQETTDGVDGRYFFAKSVPEALARGLSLIRKKVGEGFKPTPYTDETLPELSPPKKAAKKPKTTPLPPDVAESVSEFREWLDAAAAKKAGLVLFYY